MSKMMNAKVFVSEPWDFGTQCGVGPFFGEVLEQKHGRLLIRLRQAIVYGTKHYEAVVASYRHANISPAEVAANEQVAANLLFVPSADSDILEGRYPLNAFAAAGSVSTDGPWTPEGMSELTS